MNTISYKKIDFLAEFCLEQLIRTFAYNNKAFLEPRIISTKPIFYNKHADIHVKYSYSTGRKTIIDDTTICTTAKNYNKLVKKTRMLSVENILNDPKEPVKKKDKPLIYFSFDSLDILAASDKNVYLRGHILSKQPEKQCVIILSTDKFHKSLDLWLRDKKQYTQQSDTSISFCGVGGIISSIDYIKWSNNSTIYIDGKLEKVNSYIMMSFDDTCDMEHG